MKKILVLFSIVLLASSCIKQMEEPESAKIAGMWAAVDENGFTNKYISFEYGYIAEEVSRNNKTFYVADKSVWACTEDSFRPLSSQPYSVVDGILSYDNNHHMMLVDGDAMILGDITYSRIEDFRSEYYSTINLSNPLVTFAFNGGNVEWPYTIANPVDGFVLTVKAPDWVKNVRVTGDKIYFTVPETSSIRTGNITISYPSAEERSLSITQKAAEINLEKTSVTLGYSASSSSFTYSIPNSQSGYALSVETTADWITNVKDNGSSISFSVAENNSGASRTGKITLSYGGVSKVFTVTQTYSASSISLTSTSGSHDYTSGTYTFKYTVSNPREGQKATVSSSDSWITSVIDSNGTVSYMVTENNSGSARTGKITVTYGGVSKNFAVTQSYSAASLSLSPTSASHDYTSATYTFKYTISNPREGQKATVSTSDFWITSVTDSNGTVSYKVSRNTTGSSRSGKITVKYGDQSNVFTINQSAASLTLSSSSATCTYASVSKSFSITIPNRQSDLAVSVKSNVTWITGVSESSGTVSYAVAENNSGSSRTGKITVTYAGVSKEFTVTQSYSATSLSLSPTSASHDYTSATYTFKYTILNPREGQKATVSTTDSWITGVTDNNGTVSYTVAENNSGSSRTGKITVAYAGVSKDFTVSQSYSAVSLSLSPTSASHDYTSTTYTFTYSISNPREGQKATVSTIDTWITGITDNNGTVSYAVTENNSGSSRTGKITVSYAGISKEFILVQAKEPVNLSALGSANCYGVSDSGTYCFKSVKGNSSTSVGTVSSVAVLWESFGTSTAPSVGDLVKSVSYKNGNIYFDTAITFKEGNAVIAAKDASGKILWSWHIWFTDHPQEQVYYKSAGTMMDRNLGATSATPGDVGALGLLYQWGRKDPFLGSASISDEIEAKSTIIWPSSVSSNSSRGTIEYATAHPTTFITRCSNNDDWYYAGSSSTDNTRWTTSDKAKSIYDPCPNGWRVPDGDSNGVWSTALGSSSLFINSSLYSNTSEGMNFSGKFGSASVIWYPASGRRSNYGSIDDVGSYSYYWSASPYDNHAYLLVFNSTGLVRPMDDYDRAYGFSVRCIKE